MYKFCFIIPFCQNSTTFCTFCTNSVKLHVSKYQNLLNSAFNISCFYYEIKFFITKLKECNSIKFHCIIYKTLKLQISTPNWCVIVNTGVYITIVHHKRQASIMLKKRPLLQSFIWKSNMCVFVMSL